MKSENSWVISMFMSLTFYSSSPPVGSVAAKWGSGTVRVIVEVRRPTTSASLSGFFSKVEVIVAKIFGLWVIWPVWGTGSRYPPTSKRGDFVNRFCTWVKITGNFYMYAWRSLSLSNFSFTASDIALLHKLSGLIKCYSGICSPVTFVGDGGGGIDTRSTTFSGIDVWVILAFFGRLGSAPASTNIWN